eukprot:11115489-Alexandrium_andersonii.AAC.1
MHARPVPVVVCALRASNTPRASALPGDRTAPEVAMDHCFLTKDGSGTSVRVLVIQDRDSRAILARA